MNYHKVMQATIDELIKEKRVPKLLLHSCCAPCSSHVITTLMPYFDITILYYNPNIEPKEEYEKRKEEQKRLIASIEHQNELTIVDCDYDPVTFHCAIKGLEHLKEGSERCFKCYELRLGKTALLAKEGNFDYFGTTLTVSPYKNSAKLNEIGSILEKKYDIKYLYSDFKKDNGYKKSIELSKKYNLYRQDYCGCVYSKAERENYVKSKNMG